MIDPGNAEAAAIRLAEISREIDDMEKGRAALLERLNRTRNTILSAGQRTAAMRASVDLMCDHMTNVAMAFAELRALEEEMREVGRGLADNDRETTGLLFEADSFSDTLEETEDDLDRLSAIIIEGKVRNQRGH